MDQMEQERLAREEIYKAKARNGDVLSHLLEMHPADVGETIYPEIKIFADRVWGVGSNSQNRINRLLATGEWKIIHMSSSGSGLCIILGRVDAGFTHGGEIVINETGHFLEGFYS